MLQQTHDSKRLYAVQRVVQLLVRLATLLFLLILFAACSTTTAIIRPDRPPEELLQRCQLGPEPPDGDQPLAVIASVVKDRDKAARACVERNGRLIDWAERVTRSEKDQVSGKPAP